MARLICREEASGIALALEESEGRSVSNATPLNYFINTIARAV